jgi:TRAP transporter 4TM/12TM fusion protein
MSKSPELRSKIIAFISLCWALFQLSLPSFLILDSVKIRCIHLAFAMLLVFITLPVTRGLPAKIAPFLKRITVPYAGYIGAVIAAVASLYLMLDWNGIASRSGIPNTVDIIFGLLVVIFVLEASRRAVGPALPIIVILFTLYAFLGPRLPSVFAFRGVSLTKFLTQIALSTEGIYGIPLRVSARIVYLFVLLGALLEAAGAGHFFIKIALSLLGRFRGGPAKAAVVASGLMGSISGSSIANIVTTGTFTIPLMKKVGYPPKKAAAIEVAASTDGQLMPPIMGAAAFIIAEYVNVPYIEVVKAAAIPAFVSYCALFYITHLEACKLDLKGLPPKDIPDLKETLKNGWHFLIPLVFLLTELLILRHSAEKAVFTAILILIPVIIYEQLKNLSKSHAWYPVIKNTGAIFVKGCINGSKNMIPVALATAAAGIVVGIINMGIGSMIIQIVEILSGGNIFLLLLITAVASLLLGMGLPTTATYIVMASLTAPILVEVGTKYGIEIPLMAAHLFCFYFGILADDTPPVGLASYAAAAIAESEPIPTGIQGFLYDLRTTIIPFMFIFNTELILFGITSWIHGIWIFLTAILAACLFTSVLQGRLLRTNRWYEVPFILIASLLLFNPGLIGSFAPKAVGYGIGLVLFGLVVVSQRIKKNI